MKIRQTFDFGKLWWRLLVNIWKMPDKLESQFILESATVQRELINQSVSPLRSFFSNRTTAKRTEKRMAWQEDKTHLPAAQTADASTPAEVPLHGSSVSWWATVIKFSIQYTYRSGCIKNLGHPLQPGKTKQTNVWLPRHSGGGLISWIIRKR